MADLDYEAQFRAAVNSLDELKKAAWREVDSAVMTLGSAVADRSTADHSGLIAYVHSRRVKAEALTEAVKYASGFLTGQLLPPAKP